MARKTFGRSGQTIVIDDSFVSPFGGEIRDDERPGPIDSGTNGDIKNTPGDDNRQDSGEIGSNFVETGETVRVSERGSEYVQPANVVEPKPKRKWARRKPKPDPAAQAASANVLSVNLEKILFSMHTMGAALLAEPDLEIDKDEAALPAEALKEVALAYDFTQIFNPRVQALIDLGLVVMTVHGPRVVKIYHKHQRKGTVTVMRPAQTGD